MSSASGRNADLRRSLLSERAAGNRPNTPDANSISGGSCPVPIPLGSTRHDASSSRRGSRRQQQQQQSHSPPFELIDHYTLRQPVKVVGSSGRHRYVIDGLQHQLIFEAERVTNDRAGETGT
jgi:hypothetical protein